MSPLVAANVSVAAVVVETCILNAINTVEECVLVDAATLGELTLNVVLVAVILVTANADGAIAPNPEIIVFIDVDAVVFETKIFIDAFIIRLLDVAITFETLILNDVLEIVVDVVAITVGTLILKDVLAVVADVVAMTFETLILKEVLAAVVDVVAMTFGDAPLMF
jgi:hypothetical protein